MTHIIIFALAPELERGWLGSPARAPSHGDSHGVSQGCGHSNARRGRIYFQSHWSACWQCWVSWGLLAWGSRFLSRSISQLPLPWASAQGSSQCGSFEQVREQERRVEKMEASVFYLRSITFAVLDALGASHWIQTTLKGRGWHKSPHTREAGVTGIHLWSYPSQWT